MSGVYLLLVVAVVGVPLYYLTPAAYRRYTLLAISCGYILLACQSLFVYLLYSGALCFAGGRWLSATVSQKPGKDLDRGQKKAFRAKLGRIALGKLTLLVALQLAPLLLLKYFGMARAMQHAVAAVLPAPKVLLPIGISYYTLLGISYLIDVKRRAVAPGSFLQVLGYITYFPALLEGPLTRYGDLSPQLTAGNAFCYSDFCRGLQLILWGLFQKLVVADRVAVLVSGVLRNPGDFAGSVVALAAVGFVVQLYFDFCGCIDIARGCSALFGVTLAQNFDQPFAATTISGFWLRWHMSLGAFLRDYIFYPVSLCPPVAWLRGALSRRGFQRTAGVVTGIIASFFVWTAMGLWHGDGYKYFVYGMYYFALQSLGNIYQNSPLGRFGAPAWLGRCRTFVLVCFGMLLFYAPTPAAAGGMLWQVITRFQPSGLLPGLAAISLKPVDWGVLALGVGLRTGISAARSRGVDLRGKIAALPTPVSFVIWYGAIFAIIILGAYGFGWGGADPLYGQF